MELLDEGTEPMFNEFDPRTINLSSVSHPVPTPQPIKFWQHLS